MKRCLLIVAALVACRGKKGTDSAPIAAVSAEKKANPSWLGTLRKPLAITLGGSDDETVAALVERYRKVQPLITLKREPSPAATIKVVYGAQTIALDASSGVDFTEPKGTSYLLARAIHEARDAEDGIKHRIAFLSGEGQQGYAELAKYFAVKRPSYVLEKFDPERGDKAVPAHFEALVVATPTDGIFPKELRRVDEFLMRGKPVALWMNNMVVKPADPSLNLRVWDTGMLELLRGYGVVPVKGVTIDLKQYIVPTNDKGKTKEAYGMVFVATPTSGSFDPRSSIFIGLKSVVVPFANELTLDSKLEKDGLRVEPVLQTSPSILTLKGETISAFPDKYRYGFGGTGKPESRKAALAFAFDGNIPSAFPDPGDAGVVVPRSARSRLFVLSSAAFLANPFADAGKSPFGGEMPGIDPHLGEDAELIEYGTYYEPRRPEVFAFAKQVCDWLLRIDQEVEP